MLFLKRASDLFDERRAAIESEGHALGFSQADIGANLKDEDSCTGKYFFVPERARWSAPRHTKTNQLRRYDRVLANPAFSQKDHNCNIRRYVDNAPPPEPHDVCAHLHGGVPVAEVDALQHFWANYPGLREGSFTTRPIPNSVRP